MIYADNAATTALDIDAFEAMKPYLLKDMGMRLSPIRLQDQQKKRWPLPEKPLLTASVHSRRKFFSPPVVPRAIIGLLKVHCNTAMVALF